MTPAIHPGIDIVALITLGCIVSHAYLTCGILPVRVVFPCLAQMLLPHDGLTIPDKVCVQTFFDSLSVHNLGVLKMAYEEIKQKRPTSSEFKSRSIQVVLGLYGCRELPHPDYLQRVSLQIAKFQFQLQPSAAISEVKTKIAVQHAPFWKSMSLGEL